MVPHALYTFHRSPYKVHCKWRPANFPDQRRLWTLCQVYQDPEKTFSFFFFFCLTDNTGSLTYWATRELLNVEHQPRAITLLCREPCCPGSDILAVPALGQSPLLGASSAVPRHFHLGLFRSFSIIDEQSSSKKSVKCKALCHFLSKENFLFNLSFVCRLEMGGQLKLAELV